jgi:hypothetical protein
MTIVKDRAADFVLESDWQLDAQPEELTAIVLDREMIYLWCPSVFLDSKLIARGGEDGLGMTIRAHSKGFLPYSFFFEAKVVDLVRHRYLKLAVIGDLEGFAEMSVSPSESGGCHATFLWMPTIRHPYLRPLVRLLDPVFVWNHRWAMRYAHRLLQAEVYRRRKPLKPFSPAQATFPHNLAIYRAWQRRHAEYRGLF